MRPSDLRRFRGVSLIELMVALLIGTILVLGLVEVFAASRTAYQLSTGLARVQENGRFALDFLRRDLRMAGHLGCVNDQARFLPENVTASRPALVSTFLTATQQAASDYAAETLRPLRFDLGIEGYDAKVNGSGGVTQTNTAVTIPATPVVAAAASEWSPALPDSLFTDLKGGTDDEADPIRNSDIVVLRFFSPVGAQVTTFAPGAPATISFKAAQAARLTENVTSPPGLFGITDCMTAAVFQATSLTEGTPPGDGNVTVNTTGLNESGFLGQQNFVTGQSMLYRAESLVYYVGLNAARSPALYRLRYSLAPNGTAIVPNREEMVDGIESMQLQYGLDSRLTAANRPTGNMGNGMVASAVDAQADKVTAWRRVGLVQVGLLARSPDTAAALQRDAAAPPLAPLGVNITPPNDQRYRFVYEDSIALRNRLFGN